MPNTQLSQEAPNGLPNTYLPVDVYIAECHAKCEAPIKQPHIRLVSSRIPYWRHVTGNGAAFAGAGEGAATSGAAGATNGYAQATTVVPHTNEKKKARIAKNRKAVLQEKSARLCTVISKGGTCSYGDKCKFTHDVDGFLKNKPDDLVGACPWVFVTDEGSGKWSVCPYGYGCRYFGAHDRAGSQDDSSRKDIDQEHRVAVKNRITTPRAPDDARFWMDDGTIPDGRMPVVVDVVRRVLRPMNELGIEARNALRKRTYDFTPTEEALQGLGIKDTKKAASKLKKAQENHADTRNAQKRRADEHVDREIAKVEGCIEDDSGKKMARDQTRKVFDARGKTYLAPLTTVGNLPFRRLCKRFGADITCGEMAMGLNLMQGQLAEWALLKRHPDEDFFGVQVCGAHADVMTYCAQLIEDNCDVDFVDINCGCPIDCVVEKGAGSACLNKPKKLEQIVRGMKSVLTCPVTIKMRRGFDEGNDVAHKLIPRLGSWGVSAAVLHGRTRQQRYSKPADWEYIKKAARANDSSCQVIGNGDVYGWQDHVSAIDSGEVATTYVARGALIKPWIFTEIKERRDWDISASERLDIVRQFVHNGLEHWGSDSQGVENTRRFLLEWLSFTHRYIPSGLLEVLPQRSNWRPSAFVGRSDLESLLASPDPSDWIRISTWFLGPVPNGYKFLPKHSARSHSTASEGNRP